jgi:hypothetical protein
MQAILYGPNGLPLTPQTPAIVDPSFAALRASIRPLEYQFPGQILGHYRGVGITSAAAFSSGVVLAAFRWAPASGAPVAVITRIRAALTVATTVTAQRMDALLAFFVRQYTVTETTNLTAVSVTNHQAKDRTSMGTSLLPSNGFAVTSAAGGLTGGTGTEDSNAFGHMGTSGGAAVAGVGTGVLTTPLYDWTTLGGHPVVLAPNEGVRIKLGTTAVATGTVTVTVEFEWAEVMAF